MNDEVRIRVSAILGHGLNGEGIIGGDDLGKGDESRGRPGVINAAIKSVTIVKARRVGAGNQSHIRISCASVQAHFNRGDTAGNCELVEGALSPLERVGS